MSSKPHKSGKFCGSCQHYSWTIGPQRKTTCNNLGGIETSPACIDYSINPFVLQDFENVLKPLADVLRAMPVTTLPLFTEIVSQERSLRRKGYYFLEKVAVKYYGTPYEKYLSNYVLARVYSANNEGVFVISKSGIRMFAFKDAVIKLEEFLELRKKLKEEGKAIDPSFSARASTKQKLAVVETLDDIIARGLVDQDLDYEIKNKLNLKKYGTNLDNGIKVTELSLSTARKPNKDHIPTRDPKKIEKLRKAEELAAKKRKKESKKSKLKPLITETSPVKKKDKVLSLLLAKRRKGIKR